MNVVHLWAHGGIAGGGGGVAMERLHRALRARGHESAILEEGGEGTDGLGHERHAVPRWRLADGGVRRVTSRLGLNDIHRLSSFALLRHPLVRDAEVLHVHGTHSGFLNYLALPLLARARPVVFTMHDMWALTGHCAFSLGCHRWRTGCGRCPHPEVVPAVRRDATHIEWRLKRRALAAGSLHFVAPSRWLRDLAVEGLPTGTLVEHLPNGVDTEIYRPVDQRQARDALGVPLDRFLLLFASVNLADPRKGGDLIAPMLQAVPDSIRARTTILLLGPGGENPVAGTVPQLALGSILDEERKALAYAAADVTVLPTRADNDPLVLAESMACGTPSASFNVGGIPEIVRPDSGVLADAEDSAALGRKIGALLGDESRLRAMGEAARAQMVAERSLERWVERHLEVYRRAGDSHRLPARSTYSR